jgi:hypothetical protein
MRSNEHGDVNSEDVEINCPLDVDLSPEPVAVISAWQDLNGSNSS